MERICAGVKNWDSLVQTAYAEVKAWYDICKHLPRDTMLGKSFYRADRNEGSRCAALYQACQVQIEKK